jgi:hypothetical protein
MRRLLTSLETAAMLLRVAVTAPADSPDLQGKQPDNVEAIVRDKVQPTDEQNQRVAAYSNVKGTLYITNGTVHSDILHTDIHTGGVDGSGAGVAIVGSGIADLRDFHTRNGDRIVYGLVVPCEISHYSFFRQ